MDTYPNPLQIEGTLDLEILQKEILSVRTPNLTVNRLESEDKSFQQTHRVYLLNRLMTFLHIEQPIPYQFKEFQKIDIKLSNRDGYTYVESKPSQYYKVQVPSTGKEITIMHTSLYKVEYLSFKPESTHSLAHLWRIHQEPQFEESADSTSTAGENFLKDKYIWGVEIIQGLKTNSIDKITITEEIIYF